jgi:hypothetical protein
VAREAPGCGAAAEVDERLAARRQRLWTGGLHASTTARLCQAVLHLEHSRAAAAAASPPDARYCKRRNSCEP